MSGQKTFRFLKLTEVMSKTALSRSGVYKGMRLGTFPKQIKLSHNAVVWLESDVEDWMAYVLLQNGR